MSWMIVCDTSCEIRALEHPAPGVQFALAPFKIRIGTREYVDLPTLNVPQMLQALREAGFVVCVATSKPYPVALRVLRHFGLEQAFDYIGGASMDASLDTKTAVMQLVLDQPQLAGKCPVMVGDRENDMQGARDCGIPAVGALYGYGSQAELAPFSPVFCAQDVPALCAWLLAHRACKEGAKA